MREQTVISFVVGIALTLLVVGVTVQDDLMEVGDCFELPAVPHALFKVRTVNKNSYYAGKIHEPNHEFNKKYPAVQITRVSFEEPRWKTDCYSSDSEYSKSQWEKAIIREYYDRKDSYDEDAFIPKHKDIK